MPIYDYDCTACDHRTSKLRKIAQRDDPLPCNACGAATTKAVSASAVNTRGAGTMAPARQPGKLDTSKLPVVGRDGKLYSADGSKVLRS